jgi:hypothetical protein
MNINFDVNNNIIDNILISERDANFKIKHNNYVFNIILKNPIQFTNKYYILSTHRINKFYNSYVCLVYKLIIKKNHIININHKPNKNKILKLYKPKDFYNFTKIYTYSINNQSFINWKKLSKHYSGLDIYGNLTDKKRKKLINNIDWLYNNIFTNGGYLWRMNPIKDIQFIKCIKLPSPSKKK